jgi:carboxyl-terminal processing protease
MCLSAPFENSGRATAWRSDRSLAEHAPVAHAPGSPVDLLSIAEEPKAIILEACGIACLLFKGESSLGGFSVPRWNLAWLLGVSAVGLLGLTISYSAPSREQDRDYELVKLFVSVLKEVDHDYVRELDPDAKRKLVEDMINGGLVRLDEHSAFINPRRYKQFTKESQGKFSGVGIAIDINAKTGLLTVLSPIVGTPAYEAGVLAGDIILKVNGKSTEHITHDEAVDLIQGESGTKVTLTVLHEGAKKTEDITITRAVIMVPSVLGDRRKMDSPEQWSFFIDEDNKIGYIRLTSFNETTADELRKVLEELKKEGLRGLILDLRFNPGGLLRSAVDVSRMFIDQGRIVTTRGRNHEEEAFDADGKSALLVPAKDYPIAVLINKYSASASEIVAAALQDHTRAVIVGERSFGKGSVQNIIKMEGGKSALKLTTATYWRPSGKNIHRFGERRDFEDWGVSAKDKGPDHPTDSKEGEAPRNGKSPNNPTDSKETDEWGVSPNPGFAVAVKPEERLEYFKYRQERDFVHGKAGAKPPPKTDAEKPKKPFEDRVLTKALDYLRGEIKKAG